MPPVIGLEPFHIKEHMKSKGEFQLALGRALGQWALIEERLSYWFEDATGMPNEMARAIFFAPRTFTGRADLLEAARKHSDRLRPCAGEFIKEATRKAGQFASFRNRIAHGEQSFDVRKESPTFKQTILISGRYHPEKAADNAITIDQLNAAKENFRELGSGPINFQDSSFG